MLKRTVMYLICVFMLSGMVALLSACSSKDTNSTTSPTTNSVQLNWMMVGGTDKTRNQDILNEINKVLTDKLNITLAVQAVDQDAYKITLNGLKGVDLIATADYLGYYDNARSGAYAEIKPEDIQNYAPTWYKDNADKLLSATVDGKIYAVPGARPSWNAPVLMLREDWFPEGMTAVNTLDDLDAYFANVKKIKPEIVPFALDAGTATWLPCAYEHAYTGLMAPGGPSCVIVLSLNKFDDPNYKMVRTWEQPQLASFYKKIKDFADKGYMSPDALNNPTPMNDAFVDGQSGTAWATNIPTVNHVDTSLRQKDPNARLAVYDPGQEMNIPIDTYSPMGSGLAIPTGGKNIDKTLQLIELLYTDQDLYRMFRYGIEGTDYTINDKGEVVIKDLTNDGFGYGVPYSNTDFDYTTEGGNWSGYDALVAQVKKRERQNPFVGFGLDTTPIADISNNMWNIHLQDAVPILLGQVKDVDAAIAKLNKSLEAADIDKYETEAFNQIQKYIQDNNMTQYTITK